MRAQTSHASTILTVGTRFKVKHVELFITLMKRQRTHPRHLTRASQLALCKRGLSEELTACPQTSQKTVSRLHTCRHDNLNYVTY
jgi:hypothetical protein